MDTVALFKGFWQGAGAPWRGYRYLQENPSLWKFAVLPIVLNTIITLVGLGALVYTAMKFDSSFVIEHWWDYLLKVLYWIGFVIGALLSVIILWFLSNSIFCAVFYAKLGEQTELKLGMRPDQITEVSIPYQIIDSLIALFALCVINLVLMVINFLPLIGSVLALVGSFYFNSFVFGYDFFGYPLDLRGHRRSDKLVFLKKHRGQTLGLGAVVLCLNFVPIIGSVFLATSVVGAVLLNRDIEKGQQS